MENEQVSAEGWAEKEEPPRPRTTAIHGRALTLNAAAGTFLAPSIASKQLWSADFCPFLQGRLTQGNIKQTSAFLSHSCTQQDPPNAVIVSLRAHVLNQAWFSHFF